MWDIQKPSKSMANTVQIYAELLWALLEFLMICRHNDININILYGHHLPSLYLCLTCTTPNFHTDTYTQPCLSYYKFISFKKKMWKNHATHILFWRAHVSTHPSDVICHSLRYWYKIRAWELWHVAKYRIWVYTQWICIVQLKSMYVQREAFKIPKIL